MFNRDFYYLMLSADIIMIVQCYLLRECGDIGVQKWRKKKKFLMSFLYNGITDYIILELSSGGKK